MVDEYVAVKNKKKAAQYAHPILKDILEETNGVMVYQEQVMRILNRLGGIELAKAYTCIKAISKKKEALIAANAEKYLAGAVENGLDEKTAREMWEMILKFAGYGFNKSHSTAYALIAYQTAYLKANYPVEFMAALLTGDIPGRNFKRKDALVEHMEDCSRMNLDVLAPSVNSSRSEFAVVDGKITFGLSAIKGCGGSAAESIVVEREKNGPFQDLFDFCERVDPSACNRAAIDTLIKAGGFDCFGALRSQLTAVLDRALQSGASKLKDKRTGQKSLFEAFDDSPDNEVDDAIDLPDMPEFPEKEKLQLEKEVLGFYLSAHPLEPYRKTLLTYCSHRTNELKPLGDRQEVMMGGMISSIKIAHTRNPKPGKPSKYANFDLEDLEGNIRCICWPDGFESVSHMITPDAVVLIRGSVDKRDGGDDANLLVNEIIAIEDADSRFTGGIRIHVDERSHGEAVVPKLREILRGYPGSRKVSFLIRTNDGTRVELSADKQRVDIGPELRIRLNDLLGENSHHLIRSMPKLKSGRDRNFRRRD
jgi:DNA polymerase-3 subunit alpha